MEEGKKTVEKRKKPNEREYEEREKEKGGKRGEKKFRNYLNSDRQKIVEKTYKLMHENQTLEFVESKHIEYGKFNHRKFTIFEALEFLNTLIDDSDPDVSVPNSMHAYQTAERIRIKHPQNEWLQLVGFIHDLGKVLVSFGEPQWAVVGDTFPVGCKFSKACVFYGSFAGNPDSKNRALNTKYGIYRRGIGLKNVKMSWGHDEYLYRVLKNHKQCALPEIALNVIRFHSFYPWHTGGHYMHLCAEEDVKELLPAVLDFNQYDLYSKGDELPDVEACRSYYERLVEKYIPGKLDW